MLELQVGRFAGQSEETMAQYDVVHRAFHVSFYAGVVSPRLTHLHACLVDQAYRYRKTLHHLPLTPVEVLAEHRRLMQVVLSRDADKAAIAVRNHLELTRSSAQRYFGEHWRMP
jgi:DNA-binding GntR family transcriptional regulator